MNKEIITRICSDNENFKIYHCKVIMYLSVVKEVTQTEMAKILSIKKQNMNAIFKDLCSMDVITKSRTEGRNIFWKLNPKPTLQEKGQIKMDL